MGPIGINRLAVEIASGLRTDWNERDVDFVMEKLENIYKLCDFKEPQGFTAESANRAHELVEAVFVGPVPESVIWAIALAFDRATLETVK